MGMRRKKETRSDDAAVPNSDRCQQLTGGSADLLGSRTRPKACILSSQVLAHITGRLTVLWAELGRGRGSRARPSRAGAGLGAAVLVLGGWRGGKVKRGSGRNSCCWGAGVLGAGRGSP